MKKLFFWVLLFGFLIGCQTGSVDPDPIVPPIIKKYTIQISGSNCVINPSVIEVVGGNSVEFSWIPSLGFQGSDIAIEVSINGSLLALPSNTTKYSLSSVNSDYNIVVTLKNAKQSLLIQKRWNCIKNQQRYVGQTIWQNVVGEDVISGDFEYYVDMKFQRFDWKGQKNGNGIYILKEDSLIIGSNLQGGDGFRGKILVLSPDTLTLRSVIRYYGTRTDVPNIETLTSYIH